MGAPPLARGGGVMEVRNLTVRLGGQAVLENYSLTLPDEGVTFLSAPSGAGKTTLLRVLAGLVQPERGTVTLPGRPVLLFQEDRLFPRQTVREQVEAVLPKKRRGEAGRFLELVELLEDGEKRPGQLSGGMSRRAALARALAVEGDLYLLDEPFAGVDEDRAGRILARLRGLKKPILLTGHSSALAALCDRQMEL